MLNLPEMKREKIQSFSFNQQSPPIQKETIDNYIRSRQIDLIDFVKNQPLRHHSQMKFHLHTDLIKLTTKKPFSQLPSPINKKQDSDTIGLVTNQDDTLLDDIIQIEKTFEQPHQQMIKSINEEGLTKINQYVIQHELGRGSFGKVKLAHDENNKFAIKICDRKKLKLKLLTSKIDAYLLLDREIAIMKKVDHKNIVKLHEVIENTFNEKLYLILEYMDGKSLQEQNMDSLWKLMRDLALGLDYLHNFANIVHMDIKPENLLLNSQNELKIADFGVAQIIDDEIVTQKLGTSAYQPPEVFQQGSVKGKPIDIWATGITLYQLTYGKNPFYSTKQDILKQNIINQQIQWGPKSDLVDLLQQMLEKDPNKRITAQQILQHPWITKKGKFPLSNNYQGTLNVNLKDIQNAVTRLSFNMAIKTVQRIKQSLNRSRQRIQQLIFSIERAYRMTQILKVYLKMVTYFDNLFFLEQIILSSRVFKYNKVNKQQERVILITNKAIYNIVPNGIVSSFMSILSNTARIKRKIQLEHIHAITISRFGFEFVIHVPKEYDYRYSSVDFRDQILIAICEAFISNNKVKKMPFYLRDDMVLAAFATTKKDYAKKQNRMPTENPTLMDPETLRTTETKVNAETIYNPTKSNMSIDDFQVVKVLGRGSFGKVMLCEHKKTKQLYAIKSLNKETIIQKDQIEHTKTERELLTRVNNPFLIQLIYAFQTEQKLFFVMPFIRGGELFYHMQKHKRFPEEWVKFYAAQMIVAIEYLHELGYMYRDLKPENVLVNEDGYLLITDFGLSKKLKRDNLSYSFIGTPDYLAPEIVINEDGRNQTGHNQMVDWWALGVIIYEMIVGIPPFYHENQKKLFENILNKEVRFPTTIKISDEAKDIIIKLLVKQPEKRLYKNIQQHPWFADIEFNKIINKEIKAPMIPQIGDKYDVQNFDKEYTQENPQFSMADQNDQLVRQFDVEFQGMTFQQGL